MKSPPAAKSIVQPDFINTFYIHIASAYKPYTPFLPASTCMLLASIGWEKPVVVTYHSVTRCCWMES